MSFLHSEACLVDRIEGSRAKTTIEENCLLISALIKALNLSGGSNVVNTRVVTDDPMFQTLRAGAQRAAIVAEGRLTIQAATQSCSLAAEDLGPHSMFSSEEQVLPMLTRGEAWFWRRAGEVGIAQSAFQIWNAAGQPPLSQSSDIRLKLVRMLLARIDALRKQPQIVDLRPAEEAKYWMIARRSNVFERALELWRSFGKPCFDLRSRAWRRLLEVIPEGQRQAITA